MSPIELVYLTEDPDLRDLCRRYWAMNSHGGFVEKVADLAASLGVDQYQVPRVAAKSCRAFLPSCPCRECLRPIPVTSRSDASRLYASAEAAVCPDCLAATAAEEEVRRQSELRACRDSVRRMFLVEDAPDLDTEMITLREAVYLLSFLRATASEDLRLFGPAYRSRLAPTELHMSDMLGFLRWLGWIAVDAEATPLDAFNFDAAAVESWFPSMAVWCVPAAPTVPQVVDLMDRLAVALQTTSWVDMRSAEIGDLWRELALHECLGFLGLALARFGLDFNAGAKTKQAISYALESYSVGQACNFIFNAVKSAAADVTAGRATRGTAGVFVPGDITRRADAATANGWLVKHYRRNYDSARTVLSEVFFDAALGIGEEAGWTSVPLRPEQGRSGDTERGTTKQEAP